MIYWALGAVGVFALFGWGVDKTGEGVDKAGNGSLKLAGAAAIAVGLYMVGRKSKLW